MADFSQYDPALVHAAIHESAHCVLTRLFGGVVWAAALGRCSSAADCNGAVFTWNKDHDQGVEARRNRMVFLLGGVIAQTLHDSCAITVPGSDLRAAEEEAWRICGRRSPWADVDAEISEARARADRLVRMLWSHILEVALVLLRFHETIDRISLARQGASVDPCDEKHCLDGGAL